MPPHVSAIVLAAGKSRRMGCCKQLLPLGDRPVIVHCLTSIISAGISEIIVVVGAQAESISDAVAHLPVTIVSNLDTDSDMTASLRAGMQAVSCTAAGVIVALADHPLVAPATYQSLVRRHCDEREKILIPTFNGVRGHPTLFPYRLLNQLPAGRTLRDISHAFPELVDLIEMADGGVALDMDTWEDYLNVQKAFCRKCRISRSL
jgi:molybdenum cofactor cytidylyltransferase